MVGSHQVPFNVKATRWLGIYLDSRLGFSEHAARSVQGARISEKRLSSIVARHGVPPFAARHLQEAIVGSTLMYRSEITWRGQKGMSKAFQRGINRMSRSSLGVLSSIPVAFLQAEGGSTPAVARLDRRQEAFAVRLALATRGPHTNLVQATASLGQRLGEIWGKRFWEQE